MHAKVCTLLIWSRFCSCSSALFVYCTLHVQVFVAHSHTYLYICFNKLYACICIKYTYKRRHQAMLCLQRTPNLIIIMCMRPEPPKQCFCCLFAFSSIRLSLYIQVLAQWGSSDCWCFLSNIVGSLCCNIMGLEVTVIAN